MQVFVRQQLMQGGAGAAAAAAAITAARGAPKVALGAYVAPPAATSEAEGHTGDYCG